MFEVAEVWISQFIEYIPALIGLCALFDMLGYFLPHAKEY